MPPLATEETSKATMATHLDESKEEGGALKSTNQLEEASGGSKDPAADKKIKREPLLAKTSQAALSVCAYDPQSATIYALVEPAHS